MLAAPAARADFHLIKIREVYPGTVASGADAFIELQMYAAGQTDLSDGHVCLYTAVSSDGSSPTVECALQDVANGQNQRTILIRDLDSGAAADSKTELGTLAMENLDDDYGAVCIRFSFGSAPDCMSWGIFNGGDPVFGLGGAVAGAPAVPEGLPSGMSLTRSISRRCPTLLDASDDTDDSASDFAVTTPTPRLNSVAPTESPCATARVFCAGVRATNVGSKGADLLRGTRKRDVIVGRGGRDTIRGLGGNDVLCGGKGRDRLIGGKGRDRLLGGPGRDLCRGGPKRDVARACEVKRAI